MGSVFCDNCGVSLLDETAKFCRACGKPTPPLSEASTKRFDEQPGFQIPTSPVGPSPTSPAYMAPFEFHVAPQTLDFNRKRKRNVILVASMLALMLLALGGLLIFLNFGQGTPAVVTTGVSPPEEVIQQPSEPPRPPVIETATKVDRSLIYPGSQQTMSVNSGDGNSVLQLHSNAPASKVVDWYITKLKISKKVSIAGQTILQAGDIGLLITGGDDGADILITQGRRDSKQ